MSVSREDIKKGMKQDAAAAAGAVFVVVPGFVRHRSGRENFGLKRPKRRGTAAAIAVAERARRDNLKGSRSKS